MRKEDVIAAAKSKRLQESASYFKLFSSPEGKQIMSDLEELFSNRTSIVPGDPYATHANEGAREVVLYIKQRMEEAQHAD